MERGCFRDLGLELGRKPSSNYPPNVSQVIQSGHPIQKLVFPIQSDMLYSFMRNRFLRLRTPIGMLATTDVRIKFGPWEITPIYRNCGISVFV